DFMIRSLGGNVHQSRRNNRVCIDGAFVKYPIENDLAGLPTDLRNRCLLDFLFNEHKELAQNPANLDEWFLGHFGQGLTDLYFRPYNEKTWNVPLAELSMTWSERIPQPPSEDVVKGALGMSTEGYLHQLYYHYPLTGGYEALTSAWASLLSPEVLRLNTPVREIVPGPDGVEIVTDRGRERFDRVVCTAPIPSMLTMVPEPPLAVRAAADSLQFNPLAAVTLGFRGEDPNQFTAVYFPDPEFLVNRISAPCVFSPHNGPPGSYSIQAEITDRIGGTSLALSDDELVDHVVKGLVRYGIVSETHPLVFSDVQRLEYAYVVYTVDYEAHVETVRAWAETQGVYIHGRFGAFEYLNVDGCVIRSLEMATRLNNRSTTLDEIDVRTASA
ncbi:MAG: FAD-dependent oxidoreductase, partial [Thermoplasmata archaeon]|nr:FAD-dependent oxidoreductase [Thermoplasmata archaeon]